MSVVPSTYIYYGYYYDYYYKRSYYYSKPSYYYTYYYGRYCDPLYYDPSNPDSGNQIPSEDTKDSSRDGNGALVAGLVIAGIVILFTLLCVFCCCLKLVKDDATGKKRLMCRKAVKKCTCCFRKQNKVKNNQTSTIIVQ